MKLFFSFPNGFSNLSNSRFRSLIGWIQAIKLRKREFDRLEKIWQFYQPSSCLLKKKRLFYLILRGKTLFLFFQKKKENAQNQRAKLIFWKWVKLLLYNFGLFQQVFENLKLNKLVKEERRLDLEDRIWRLKFGKTQFWSCILKNEFESLYFWKASFHFFGVW